MREPKFANTAKYVTEFDYSLAGKTYCFAMDDGQRYVAWFLSGEIVMWAGEGEPFRWEKYSCLKADETTYFVVMELFGQPVRICRSLVLDLENALLTPISISANRITGFGPCKTPRSQATPRRSIWRNERRTRQGSKRGCMKSPAGS